MNAAEARKLREKQGKKSLSARMREDPGTARRMDAYLAEFRLEQQLFEAMQSKHITAAELARRIKCKPASISRDLAGALNSAKLGRVREMANAVGYDVVAVLVPQDPVERRKTIARFSKELSR
jgi:hypothetical protein